MKRTKDLTLKDLFLGYLTLCIPAAMLARVVRKVVRKKGSSLEVFLMDYYYTKERKLLDETA